MAALIGTMYRTPARPSGIIRLSAASGPYAAELSPSSPKMGIPCAGPICSARSSLVLIGLPTTRSRMFMGGLWNREIQGAGCSIRPLDDVLKFQKLFLDAP